MSKKRVTIYVEEDEWSSLQVFLLKLSADRGERVSAGSYLMGKYKGIGKKAQPEKHDSHKPIKPRSMNKDIKKVEEKSVEPIVKKLEELIEKKSIPEPEIDRSWDDSAPNPKAGKK